MDEMKSLIRQQIKDSDLHVFPSITGNGISLAPSRPLSLLSLRSITGNGYFVGLFIRYVFVETNRVYDGYIETCLPP